MAGTEGAYCTPAFSPDGQWLTFFDTRVSELKKIAIQGGPPITLVKAGGLLGSAWASQDSIIYSDADLSGLSMIPSRGGTPALITHLDAAKGETDHRWPAVLPGGRAFIFVAGNGKGPDEAQIVAQSLDTGQQRVLVQGGTFPQYLQAGYLAYVRDGKLMVVPFDARRLQVTGQTIPVSEDVQESGFGASQFSVSSQGSLAYVPPSRAHRKLAWVTRNGTEELLPTPAQNFGVVRLSPDGRRIAMELGDQIWLYDLLRDTLTRFTVEGDSSGAPVWSPDGKRLAFLSETEGRLDVFWQPADGSAGRERLTGPASPRLSWAITTGSGILPSSWSPDGQFLAYSDEKTLTHADIWVLRLTDRKPLPFLQTPFSERAPAFSPDGRWLAYSSDESGRYEVYVRSYPDAGAKYVVSTEGGTEPLWNPKGRELFYRNGNKVMAVDIQTKLAFSAAKPRLLFEGQYASIGAPLGRNRSFDVSPDGQRFLMTKPSSESTQINLVLNWIQELQDRAAPGQ